MNGVDAVSDVDEVQNYAKPGEDSIEHNNELRKDVETQKHGMDYIPDRQAARIFLEMRLIVLQLVVRNIIKLHSNLRSVLQKIRDVPTTIQMQLPRLKYICI